MKCGDRVKYKQSYLDSGNVYPRHLKATMARRGTVLQEQASGNLIIVTVKWDRIKREALVNRDHLEVYKSSN